MKKTQYLGTGGSRGADAVGGGGPPIHKQKWLELLNTVL